MNSHGRLTVMLSYLINRNLRTITLSCLIIVTQISSANAQPVIETDNISATTEAERSLAYPIKYVLFYQTVGLAFFASLDRETTEFDSFSLSTFERGFKEGPERDNDSAFFNYFLHPLWGSETYLRARSQNYAWWESFLFSTASSIVWEYGMENFVTQPSQQDLIITSTAGSVLGEIRYRLKQNLVGKEGQKYRILEVAIDPIQSFTEVVGDFIGQDWREPAYRETRATRNTAYLDITPTISSKGDIGLAMRYEIQF